MRITAEGYSRTVVGTHTVTDKALSETSIKPTDDGATVIVARTNQLGLTGHFTIRIHLSLAEINQVAQAATVTRLERKIEKLEAKLAKLS